MDEAVEDILVEVEALKANMGPLSRIRLRLAVWLVSAAATVAPLDRDNLDELGEAVMDIVMRNVTEGILGGDEDAFPGILIEPADDEPPDIMGESVSDSSPTNTEETD